MLRTSVAALNSFARAAAAKQLVRSASAVSFPRLGEPKPFYLLPENQGLYTTLPKFEPEPVVTVPGVLYDKADAPGVVRKFLC